MTTVKGGNSAGPADVAIETISGEMVQLVKLLDATAGSTTRTGVAANPLKVDGSGATQPVSGTFFQATQPVSVAAAVAVTDNAGTLTVDAPVGTPVFVRLSDGSSAIATLPVSLASVPSHAVTNAGTFAVQTPKSATGTTTSVNDTASSTTLLASNASRLGATIYNDSASDLYVKLGATASTTSFAVKLVQDAYFEVPFGYTGIIDGIWSADSTGAARITELT